MSPIEQAILDATRARGAEKSICPSEVARALDADRWRELLTPVRMAAKQLAETGRIDILRKGRPVTGDDVRGVIRLRWVGDA